jgi:hypothetical protein
MLPDKKTDFPWGSHDGVRRDDVYLSVQDDI